MKKADSPEHKRHIIRMYYTGEHLPLGVRLWNQQKIEWTMKHVIIPQCMTNNEGENQIEIILKNNGLQYSKQHPIVIADRDKTIQHIYLVDFVVERKLVLEVDGSFHIKEFDEERDRQITELGYHILRIRRTDNCFNAEHILSQIYALLKD